MTTTHTPSDDGAAYVLSFDVEEHHRIEAAVGVKCSWRTAAEYARRMAASTYRILDQLEAADARATFFVVGEIARTHPRLVRAIRDAGHEVGSHGWDHRRIHRFTPDTFRTDLLQSKDALEQVTGRPVHGYRAPTFSLVRETWWAVDVLAECGYRYDSSVFPVVHDRYGIADAPRVPFLAVGREHTLLELPLLTYRVAGMNLPVAGGGYFRLFPLSVMRAGMRQGARLGASVGGMLYFHPWEFDPGQPRLPLGRLARWRTYVGVGRTTDRLSRLLAEYSFRPAIDVVNAILRSDTALPEFAVEPAAEPAAAAVRTAA